MRQFLLTIKDALRDLAPIVLVVAFFQLVVLQQPFPEPGKILIGLVAVVIGLALFIQGLELSLFLYFQRLLWMHSPKEPQHYRLTQKNLSQ